GTLLSETKGLAPGGKLVLFDARRAETKEVAALATHEEQTTISWSPPVQSPQFNRFTSRLAPYDQRYRLFGYNGPASVMTPQTDSNGAILGWKTYPLTDT